MPFLINKNEVSTLVKLINNSKGDIKSLDFEGFVHFFLQLCMLSLNRNPINLSGEPPLQTLIYMYNLFKKSFDERGESTALFDNPDMTSIGNQELVKVLNNKLTVDPEYPLPGGFKRTSHLEYEDHYKIPSYFGIKESTKIAVLLVDELLKNALKFHFVEPTSVPVSKYTAKPIMKELVNNPINRNSTIPYSIKRGPST
jgi:hypothetical protein